MAGGRVGVSGEREQPTKSRSAERIVLVGFMGAGKTTVGRLVAQRLHWRFVDLDDRICQRERREIADIFRDSGEPYFRRVESECLRALVQEAAAAGSLGLAPLVIAVGGGAFVQPNNAALLREYGFRCVFLDASVEELRRRCASGGPERPLFHDENLFRQLYEARRSGYMAAEMRVDTGGKTPEQVVEEVLGFRR
ncbi:MAG TPA: shikimate kinase [Terriglobales bacterium]